ncbi:anthrone oxygenase family protein [Metabacillus herbersteinensis]|uniref:Anthrone oxygenase family protein n=1 Tax=Metabacillus herbersteinensis TaxID=283816 RepID=A0ABV6GLT4_9BACI
MSFIVFFTLVITGFTACAEFSSYALVHPVIRSLPQEQHIRFEQSSLKTFGRIMPFLMPISVILTVVFAILPQGLDVFERAIRLSSAVMFVIATITTILFNVPLNKEIKLWEAKKPPSDWQEKRKRWMFFQAIRSWLLLLGFVLLCFSVTIKF